MPQSKGNDWMPWFVQLWQSGLDNKLSPFNEHLNGCSGVSETKERAQTKILLLSFPNLWRSSWESLGTPMDQSLAH